MTRVFVRELVTLAVVRLCARRALAHTDLQTLMRTLTPRDAKGVAHAVPHALATQVTRAEHLIAKIPFLSHNCLDRSLARYAALRQAGVDARFCVGVRGDGDDGVEGHAWVVVGGEALWEDPLFLRATPPYTTTFSFPPPATSDAA